MSKTSFRTAAKASFMRHNKASDRRQERERKIWPLYLAVRKKLTAEREREKVRQKEENRLGAQSSSCFETSSTLEQNTPRHKKPS